MKKNLIFLLTLFLISSVANASSFDEDLKEVNSIAKDFSKKNAKLNTTIDISGFFDDAKNIKLEEETLKYLDNLVNCNADKTTFDISDKTTASQEIIGFVDDKCVVNTSVGDKKMKCSFPKDKLSEISNYYKETLTKGFNGKYNFDFDMKMPEIDFNSLSEDNIDFNLKMELPKIKINKIKSNIEKIIEESCK